MIVAVDFNYLKAQLQELLASQTDKSFRPGMTAFDPNRAFDGGAKGRRRSRAGRPYVVDASVALAWSTRDDFA